MDRGECHDQATGGARGRDRRHDGGQQAAPPAAARRVGDHRRRPRRRAPLPAGLPVHARSATYDAGRRWSKPRHGSSPDGVDLVLGEIDRVDADDRDRAAGRRADARPTTTWSSPPARRRGPDQTPGMLGRRSGAGASSTSTPSTGAAALADGAAELRRRPAGRAHHRHADQVPGRAAGVHLPRRRLAARARHARPGRAGLRHAAAGRVHQADRLRAPRAHAGRAQDRRRDRLPGRAHRQRAQVPGLLRRARDPVRPAGHRAAEHGRRLRRPVRAGRRAQLRAGGQAHPAVHGARQHLRARRRHRHPRPPRPARSRTSRSRSSSTTSSSTSPAGR